ncbi:MAG TPA: hypothetical protein PKA28_10645 [Methylomusa anaerophila]|uniref:Uncharacterized protein n=1 Tax=Methylomusa anaerophila TaxID=1930071 RepID=A0A348AIX3_9FIRM|nr:hypothetical protein [Methylomusa anaerophila]BBB91021.1 hypothetical protein MAMMFC1_01689 [Methylomusa anaerophila]HML88892.1 hypothetical protein [Methylomusa anaerophila]
MTEQKEKPPKEARLPALKFIFDNGEEIAFAEYDNGMKYLEQQIAIQKLALQSFQRN